MARWRPPQPRSSPYITPAGRRALEAELQSLWRKRREVTAALAAAAAEGDRSENAEYIYRKKELRELDRRLGYLQRRIPALQVVERVQDEARVYFGAWVTLETGDGREQEYRIVGADEFDHAPEYISVDSPLARALLKRGVDDPVRVETARGATEYWVVAIRYAPPGEGPGGGDAGAGPAGA